MYDEEYEVQLLNLSKEDLVGIILILKEQLKEQEKYITELEDE